MAVERTAVNPVTWSVNLGFNQGELVSGQTRTLYIAGQTATDDEGKPRHEGDMAAQLALSIDNLEAVLSEEACRSRTSSGWASARPTSTSSSGTTVRWPGGWARPGWRLKASTVLGVTRLALPGLLVELEGTAVA